MSQLCTIRSTSPSTPAGRLERIVDVLTPDDKPPATPVIPIRAIAAIEVEDTRSAHMAVSLCAQMLGAGPVYVRYTHTWRFVVDTDAAAAASTHYAMEVLLDLDRAHRPTLYIASRGWHGNYMLSIHPDDKAYIVASADEPAVSGGTVVKLSLNQPLYRLWSSQLVPQSDVVHMHDSHESHRVVLVEHDPPVTEAIGRLGYMEYEIDGRRVVERDASLNRARVMGPGTPAGRWVSLNGAALRPTSLLRDAKTFLLLIYPGATVVRRDGSMSLYTAGAPLDGIVMAAIPGQREPVIATHYGDDDPVGTTVRADVHPDWVFLCSGVHTTPQLMDEKDVLEETARGTEYHGREERVVRGAEDVAHLRRLTRRGYHPTAPNLIPIRQPILYDPETGAPVDGVPCLSDMEPLLYDGDGWVAVVTNTGVYHTNPRACVPHLPRRDGLAAPVANGTWVVSANGQQAAYMHNGIVAHKHELQLGAPVVSVYGTDETVYALLQNGQVVNALTGEVEATLKDQPVDPQTRLGVLRDVRGVDTWIPRKADVPVLGQTILHRNAARGVSVHAGPNHAVTCGRDFADESGHIALIVGSDGHGVIAVSDCPVADPDAERSRMYILSEGLVGAEPMHIDVWPSDGKTAARVVVVERTPTTLQAYAYECFASGSSPLFQEDADDLRDMCDRVIEARHLKIADDAPWEPIYQAGQLQGFLVDGAYLFIGMQADGDGEDEVGDETRGVILATAAQIFPDAHIQKIFPIDAWVPSTRLCRYP